MLSCNTPDKKVISAETLFPREEIPVFSHGDG
jgi:hypothetical protein